MDDVLLDYGDVLTSYMNAARGSSSQSSQLQQRIREKRKTADDPEGVHEKGYKRTKFNARRDSSLEQVSSASQNENLWQPIYKGSKSTTRPAQQEQYDKPSCESQDDQNLDMMSQNPLSLFEICTSYVAENVLLVDSFVGFPDDVGRKIFASCESKKVFDCLESKSIGAMTLFDEAYCDAVLPSLDLTGCHRALGIHLEHFVIFTHLVEVDLTSCKLGDDHDMLSYLATLTCLTCLGLADNALTDDGVQRLTAPLRMFGKGPTSLRYLILSGNSTITKRVVRYLKCFKDLQHLDLSGTSLTIADLPFLYDSLKMTLSKLTSTKYPLCSTEGWAANIVDKWKHHTAEPCSSKPKGTAKLSNMSGFYGRKKPAPMPCSSPATRDFKPRLLVTKASSSESTSDNILIQKAKKDLVNNNVGKKLGGGLKISKGAADSPDFVRKMRMKWIASNRQTSGDGIVDEKQNENSDLLSTYTRSGTEAKSPKSLWEAMSSW
ncbi:leucine-rich repeat-containing protein 42-like [Lineus longissimus]|uniref:leucine-rich repeat-containing protein 42-like n=1 Tax=Lineus longissimus TaxID=88925 RepID=UPI002B4F952A